MLAEKLLATATHPTTPDAEALAAARKLGNIIAKNGGTVASAFGLTAARPGFEAPMSFNQKRQLHQELQEKLDKAEFRIEELERELTTARGTIEEQIERIETLKVAIADKTSKTASYVEFANRARVILGLNTGWVQEFCRQSGISENVLTNARVSGTVSKALLDMLPKLKPVRNFSEEGRALAFSIKEVAFIRKLAGVKPDGEIAEKATEEFGRHITEGHIRKLRSNLKNRTGGYTDPAYGGALPGMFGSTTRRGQFNWNLFPDLEFYVCQQFINGVGASTLAKQASEETGFDISANQITQRVYNSAPPTKLIKAPKDSGELTWEEVWLIGHARVKRAKTGKGWLAPSLKALGIDPAGGQSGTLTGSDNRARKSIIGSSLKHLDPELVEKFRNSFVSAGPGGRPTHFSDDKPKTGWESLSQTEHRIIDMLVQGKHARQIARERKTALATVQWHLQNIRAKLGVSVDSQIIDIARDKTPRKRGRRPFSEFPPVQDERATRLGLNSREHQIIDLLASGLSEAQIAEKADITESTVKKIEAVLKFKLNATTTHQLIQIGRAEGYGVQDNGFNPYRVAANG